MTRLALALWIAAVVIATAGGLLSWEARREPEHPRWAFGGDVDSAPRAAGGLGDRARAVTANDPFRLDRRPAELPFGAMPAAVVPLAPREVAPRVSGVMGPPWRAAIEGISGRSEGILVSAGDTLNGWRVLSITPELVVIQAKDTTWRIEVRTQ